MEAAIRWFRARDAFAPHCAFPRRRTQSYGALLICLPLYSRNTVSFPSQISVSLLSSDEICLSMLAMASSCFLRSSFSRSIFPPMICDCICLSAWRNFLFDAVTPILSSVPQYAAPKLPLRGGNELIHYARVGILSVMLLNPKGP